jgi:lysophospholipase L1-like esterase
LVDEDRNQHRSAPEVDVMKRWNAKKAIALLSDDGLHMNDLGYRCLAHALAEEIEYAAAGAGARVGAKL